MPIHLQTGLPGSGKTLRLLVYIKELSERENRPVYYHNITDLKLSWHLMDDPKKWYELPNGSIIVFDECQDLFPVHETKLANQEHVLQLAKHRHKGYDIFMISQHPMNIHAFVRRLIDKHWHNIRAFGMNGSTVHQWNRVIDYPEKQKSDSNKSVFKFPKDAFEYYKSAEVHTIQRKLPKKLWWILIMVIFVPIFIWFAWSKISPESTKKRMDESIKAQNERAGIIAPEGQYPQIQQYQNKKELSYLESHKPEIEDFPHTAPAYKEIVKPAHAPYPAACVQMGNMCKCYTKQGTRLQTSESVCKQIVENGFFVEWDEQEQATVQPATVARVYPAMDDGMDFTNAVGMSSRPSPYGSPAK